MAAADPITTSVAHRDGAAVVSVGGEIDLSTAPAFEEAIAEALEVNPPVLAIELSEVTFMASVGLRILAATNEKARRIDPGRRGGQQPGGHQADPADRPGQRRRAVPDA